MSSEFRRISVVGLGYIGLPTAAMFAARRCQVVGVDVNRQAVDIINQGKVHIVEPELDIVVRAAVQEGLLRATTEPEPADAFLIAVPTPFKNDHEPDLSYIEAAARSIAPVLKKGDLVILESTSPVGTTEQVADWLARDRADLSFPHQEGDSADVNIAHCPERVLPGRTMLELVENGRIVGGMTARCAQRAVSLYRIFVRGECIVTDSRTAEMCKLAENSFRDVNIAFANELSIICDKFGINVWDLIRLANRHPRVRILQPGPGVGGHCIAIDPWFIANSAPEESRLIRVARAVNDSKPDWVIEKVNHAITERPGARIACFGLAFKADIDDLRESPAVHIVKRLADRHPGRVIVCEPNINSLPPDLLGQVVFSSLDEAINAGDILVLLVDHRQFKAVPVSRLEGKSVVDSRGIWLAAGPERRQSVRPGRR